MIKMLLMVLCLLVATVHGQQSYLNNNQLDCDNDYHTTEGYICNGAAPSCSSYLTFRSINHYNTPTSIAYHLGSTPSDIAAANNISDVDPLPADTSVLVPVNCSGSGHYSQHNVSYTLKPDDTYQGLTTCQALKHQNRYDDKKLTSGLVIEVPIRCACPTAEQTAAGIKYLLAYLIDLDDDLDKIAIRFGVDVPTLLAANNFDTSDDVIYPYNAVLVPLKTKPSPLQLPSSSPSPPSSISPGPPPTLPHSPSSGSSNKKWLFVGIGVGASCLLLLISLLTFLFLSKQRRHQHRYKLKNPGDQTPNSLLPTTSSDYTTTTITWSPFSSNGLKIAVESLKAYKFEDLEKATEFSAKPTEWADPPSSELPLTVKMMEMLFKSEGN